MESGVINKENLASILRGISQKRRNGILEVTYPDYQLSIFFNKGKVVEVVKSTISPAQEIVDLFKGAGLIPHAQDIKGENYSEVFQEMNKLPPEGGAISEEKMTRVIKHRVLNHLYSLDSGNGAYYTFKVQMMEADKKFATSISAGQILLDLVSLQSDSARFAATFPSTMAILKSEDAAGALSEEEEVIYLCLSSGGLSVDELTRQAMLSKFHIQDTLLGMHERGVVVIGDRASEITPKVEKELPLAALAPAAPSPAVESDAAQDTGRKKKPSFSYFTELNNRLLQSRDVPDMIVGFFIAIGFLAPWLFWRSVFSGF